MSKFLLDDNFRERLAQAVQSTLSASEAPGAAAALMINGKPVWGAGLGFQDLEKTRPLPADACFPIYSITKSLTAAAVLRLSEQGRVDLDAPFQSYLPQISFETPVSLLQLLNHTGGVPDYGGLPAYNERLKADPFHPWSAEEFLAATLFRGLLFPPGQGWQYSNPGYLLLRRVIETVLERSFQAALHSLLFQPLNLQHTAVAQSLADMARSTPGYSAFLNAGGALEDIRSRYHPGWVSHGLVLSTAGEVAQTMDAILAGPLLGPASRARMIEPVHLDFTDPLFRKPAYGLGLMIDEQSRYGWMMGHGGAGPGYSAGVLHFPAVAGQRITAAALVNSDLGELGLPLAYQIAAAAAQAVS